MWTIVTLSGSSKLLGLLDERDRRTREVVLDRLPQPSASITTQRRSPQQIGCEP